MVKNGWSTYRYFGRLCLTGWVTSGVPRSEMFITPKVNPSGYDQALEEFAGILESLQTEYIDLLLIHWTGEIPSTSNEISLPCKQGQPTGE
ncbi:unnamed protein product [Rotaria sp. Silwood1]|nr:unnamed protein product [Rotaria sp. Silwood1]